ncbi:MAG: S24 family peptidase [Bacteroidales bacterium]
MQEKEQKVSPIKQRILKFADSLGVSKRRFYEIIGVSRGTLESKSGITEDIVVKFIAAYPDVSVEWLITGKGDMLNNIATMQEKEQKNVENAVLAHQTDELIGSIPLIPLSAMAGALTDETSILEYECERYTVPAFKGADFLIPIKGNSMYPTYISGDIVACQKIPLKSLFFQWNKPYVLDTKQGALIKRIKPGSDKDHVLIVSDNKEYDPFELPCSEINAVALVLGLIRME